MPTAFSPPRFLPVALPLALLALFSAGPVLAQGATTVQSAQTLPGARYLAGPEAQADARAWLGVLAADSLEGREAASPGERRAAAHLAHWLAEMGVAPGGDMVDGARTYFQAFPVRTAGLDPARTVLTLEGGATAELGDEWLTIPSAVPDIDGTFDVVFAGYGLSDPAQGYDDYAGLDVAGKVVVVLGGHPTGIDSVTTMGGVMPANALPAKFIPAMQRGARALLIVAGGDLLENWSGYRSFALGTAMMPDDGTPPQTAPAVFGFLHPDFAGPMLAAAGAPADLLTGLEEGAAVAPIADAGRVRLGVGVARGTGEGRNVVGVLEGSGADAGEFVAIGAHYDHLGIVDGEIHNGADDDGSGTTAVLAVADALARDRAAGRGPNRSVVFVFHSAEEKGLFGSAFFTDHPERSVLGSIDRAVAQVNLDMVGREHPDSLYVIGADRLSTAFGQTVVAANAALESGGLFTLDRTFDAPDHPENLYQRSDHYNYARFGVPIVFFTDGMGANWAKGEDRDDYHRPDDDIESIDFGKLVNTARLAYTIGRVTADAAERPVVDHPVEAEAGSH